MEIYLIGRSSDPFKSRNNWARIGRYNPAFNRCNFESWKPPNPVAPKRHKVRQITRVITAREPARNHSISSFGFRQKRHGRGRRENRRGALSLAH